MARASDSSEGSQATQGPRAALRPVSVSRGDDRLFVRSGFHSYRRTYRLGEVYWGLGTAGVLAMIVGWVGWKGAHPDPSLFDMSAALEEGAGGAPQAVPVGIEGRDARGPMPSGIAELGLKEGKLAAFDSDNLYVKINGRAGFFQSFGVKTMHALALDLPVAEGDAPASIDIELYDLAKPQNALGAYNGERPATIEPTLEGAGAYHYDRNAAFMARGPYYARFIGSEESERMTRALKSLIGLFREKIETGQLPWAFQLFVDRLGIGAGQVTYQRKNAFSFGFASDVYKANLGHDPNDDIEAFVVVQADMAAAGELARKFRQGFESVGKPAGKTPRGVPLQEDEFLGTFSGAVAVDRWVVGVRGVATRGGAHEWLERLVKGVQELPEQVRASAQPPDPRELEEAGHE